MQAGIVKKEYIKIHGFWSAACTFILTSSLYGLLCYVKLVVLCLSYSVPILLHYLFVLLQVFWVMLNQVLMDSNNSGSILYLNAVNCLSFMASLATISRGEILWWARGQCRHTHISGGITRAYHRIFHFTSSFVFLADIRCHVPVYEVYNHPHL